MSKLKIAGVVKESITDGDGIRFVLFVQGCPHHCYGCHNPQTHDFNGGTIVDSGQVLEEFKANPLLSGITFSGGEPFCQAGALADLEEEIISLGKLFIPDIHLNSYMKWLKRIRTLCGF